MPKPKDEMTQTDQLLEMVFARLSTIESVLMLFWNEQPNRAELRATAATILDIRETIGLAEPSSDLSLAIRAKARRASFETIFHELLSEKDHDALRSLSASRPKLP